MGVVEKELANFELSNGIEYTIELNKGGVIHIHFANARLDLSVDEFKHYVKVIQNANEQLKHEKYR